jgi:hypothetical protein
MFSKMDLAVHIKGETGMQYLPGNKNEVPDY